MDMAVECPVCKAKKPSAEFTVETTDQGEVNLQICGRCWVVYAPARPPSVPGW
jgi:rubredoxin